MEIALTGAVSEPSSSHGASKRAPVTTERTPGGPPVSAASIESRAQSHPESDPAGRRQAFECKLPLEKEGVMGGSVPDVVFLLMRAHSLSHFLKAQQPGDTVSQIMANDLTARTLAWSE